MENAQYFINYGLLAFGILAALASLYRFARYKKPLGEELDTSQLNSEEITKTVTRQIIVVKKIEFFSLMLLVFGTILFYYIVQSVPSATVDSFSGIAIRILQGYGIFALLMLPVRWWIKRKIHNICLTDVKNCSYSMPLLMQHIKNREDLPFFWRNQAIKFIQNKFF